MDEKKPRGPMALEGLITSFLREHHLNSGGIHMEVFEAWHEVTQQQGISRTQPVLFRKGHLTVEVASAALLQELRNFKRESLRTNVNERFQREVVFKITFKIRG